MNSGLTWKKRFVSLFVVSFVAAVAGPALADETAPKADLDPMNGCIGTYCPGDESKEQRALQPSKDLPVVGHSDGASRRVCNTGVRGTMPLPRLRPGRLATPGGRSRPRRFACEISCVGCGWRV